MRSLMIEHLGRERMVLRRRDFMTGLASTSLALGMTTQARAKTDWDVWLDLLNWLPDKDALNEERVARKQAKVDFKVQRIEDASSEQVNFDFYAIDIQTLPAGMTDKELFVHIRKNLNDFFDPAAATVATYEKDDPKDWGSIQQAPLGAIMQFQIPWGPVWEDAAVVASKADGRSWVFTPVTIGIASPGQHPVSGNREFALTPKEGLAARIYTRGVDRALENPLLLDMPESFVYDGGDKLWQSFQARVVKYVVDHGGAATVGNHYFKRPLWKDVVASKIFTRPA
jgi:hypothetical protein